MIQFGHPATIIALLQVVAIIGGVLLTRGVFMVFDYPNNAIYFGAIPTLIRNFGFLLLLLPVGWTIISKWLEQGAEGLWTRRWTIISGVVILGLLLWLLYYSFSTPGTRRVGPIQSISQIREVSILNKKRDKANTAPEDGPLSAAMSNSCRQLRKLIGSPQTFRFSCRDSLSFDFAKKCPFTIRESG